MEPEETPTDIEETLALLASGRTTSVFHRPWFVDAVRADVKMGATSTFLHLDDATTRDRLLVLANDAERGALTTASEVVSIGRLLVRPPSTDDLDVGAEVDRLARSFVTAGAIAPGSGPCDVEGLGADHPLLRRVLDAVSTIDRGNAGAFVAALALELAGAPAHVRSSVSLPVALVGAPAWGSAEPTAFIAHLDLELLDGGPPGLYPHPRTMVGFVSSDASFAEAIDAAATASAMPAGAAVRWSLRDDRGGHVGAAQGPSLGAAFAVGLADLFGASTRFRRRFRRLDPLTLITGEVHADGRLSDVLYVLEKARTAREEGIRTFIAPEPVSDEVRALRSDRFRVFGAGTANEARSMVKLRLDRSAYVVGVAATLLVAIAVAFAFIRSADNARRAESEQRALRDGAAADALIASNRVASTDPRLSMLLALESNHLRPSVRAREVITAGLGAGSSLRRIFDADEAVVVDVDTIKHAEDRSFRLLMLDAEGALIERDLESGELVKVEHAFDETKPWLTMDVHPAVPWVAVVGAAGLELRTPDDLGIDRDPPSLPTPICGTDAPTEVAFSYSGTQVYVVAGRTVCVWDLMTGRRISVWSVDFTVTAATILRDEHRLLVGGDDQLVVLDIRTGQESTLDLPTTVHVTSLDADLIMAAVGTDAGVWKVDLATLEVTATPFREPVCGLFLTSGELAEPSLMVATTNALVRVDAETLGEPANGTNIRYPVSFSTEPGGLRPSLTKVGSDYPEPMVATTGGPFVVVLTDPVATQEWGAVDVGTTPTGWSVDDAGAAMVVSVDGGTPSVFELPDRQPGRATTVAGGKSLPGADKLEEGQEAPRLFAQFVSDHDQIVVAGAELTSIGETVQSIGTVYDSRTMEITHTLDLPAGPDRQVVDIAVVDDMALVLDLSGHVTTFSLPDWERTSSTDVGGHGTNKMDVSPDGSTLAVSQLEFADTGRLAGTPPTVRFFDLPDFDPIGAPNPVPDSEIVFTMTFVDNDTMVSFDDAGRLFEWGRSPDASGDDLWSVVEDRTPDGDQVDDVALSPDGDRLAVLRDSVVSVLTYPDLQPTGIVMSAIGTDLAAIGWMPDGGSIVAAERALTIHLWRVPGGDLTADVCAVVSTGLTEIEWREVLPDLPYRRQCEDVEPFAVEAPSFAENDPPTFLQETGADVRPAPTATCSDLADVAPDGCIEFGPDGRGHALTMELVATDEYTEDQDWTFRRWQVDGGTWKETARSDESTDTGLSDMEVETISLADGTVLLAVHEIFERYAMLHVVGEAGVELSAYDAEVDGTTVVEAAEFHREDDPGCCPSAYFEVRREREGSGKWPVVGMYPAEPAYVDAEQRRTSVAQSSLFGVGFGQPFAELLSASEGVLGTTYEDDPNPPTTHTWTDGITSSGTEPWMTSPSVPLTETCWRDVLCAYADPAGTFVGWSHLAPSFNPAGDPFAFEMPAGLEPISESEYSSGTIHPRTVIPNAPTGVATSVSGALDVARYAEFAGVVRTVETKLSADRTVYTSFTTDIRSPVKGGRITIRLESRAAPTYTPRLDAVGLLPARPDQDEDATPTVCEVGGAATVTMRADGAVRSWTLSPEAGMVPSDAPCP